MIKKNIIPENYDKYIELMKPFAIEIVKAQNLSNTTFTDDERVQMALDDAYIHVGEYDSTKNAMFTTFIYTILRNNLCTVQTYDKERMAPRKKGKDNSDEKDCGVLPSHIIESARRINTIGDAISNMDEDFCEPLESEDDLKDELGQIESESDLLDGQTKEFNPYDPEDCFEQAFLNVWNTLPRTDQLIVAGDPKEYILLKGELHSDQMAWEGYLYSGKGKLVSKDLSRKQIGEIVKKEESNVGFTRTTLMNKIADRMFEIFMNIYLGHSPEQTFYRILNTYKKGRNIVEKKNIAL